jgi:hypothetical protein
LRIDASIQILMSASLPPRSARDWRAEVRRRMSILWLTKSVGTICWIAGFFVAYFWVLRNPLADVTIMPLTALDRMVAFRPEALLLYASLWVYVSIAPGLLKDFRELSSYGVATLAMSAVGLVIFLVWPTAVPQFEMDLTRHPSISVLKGVDLAGNACPSLHVAFAVFTGIWMDRVLREMRSSRLLDSRHAPARCPRLDRGCNPRCCRGCAAPSFAAVVRRQPDARTRRRVAAPPVRFIALATHASRC